MCRLRGKGGEGDISTSKSDNMLLLFSVPSNVDIKQLIGNEEKQVLVCLETYLYVSI